MKCEFGHNDSSRHDELTVRFNSLDDIIKNSNDEMESGKSYYAYYADHRGHTGIGIKQARGSTAKAHEPNQLYRKSSLAAFDFFQVVIVLATMKCKNVYVNW